MCICVSVCICVCVCMCACVYVCPVLCVCTRVHVPHVMVSGCVRLHMLFCHYPRFCLHTTQ